MINLILTVVFSIIKATIGLRASKEEEILGLDMTEHGLATSYAGFETSASELEINYDDVVSMGTESMETAVP